MKNMIFVLIGLCLSQAAVASERCDYAGTTHQVKCCYAMGGRVAESLACSGADLSEEDAKDLGRDRGCAGASEEEVFAAALLRRLELRCGVIARGAQ